MPLFIIYLLMLSDDHRLLHGDVEVCIIWIIHISRMDDHTWMGDCSSSNAADSSYSFLCSVGVTGGYSAAGMKDVNGKKKSKNHS